MTGTIGVVTALPGEARKLAGYSCRQNAERFPYCRRVLKNDIGLMVVQSGMGARNAFSAARWLVEKGVTILGCFGVSGGLDSGLKPGDALFADAVLDKQHNTVSLAWKKDGGHLDKTFKCMAAEGLPVQWGPIISVQEPVLDAGDKRALFDQTKALAVDMETAAVARAASRSGLPFFAVRMICDSANVSVPEALFQCVDEKGNPLFFYLLKRIIQKPSLITHLLNMKRNFDTALAGAPHVRHCLAEMHISPAP